MKKKVISKPKTRAQMSDPWIGVPMIDRLKAAGVTDLRNNHTIEQLGNGMIRFIAIDPNKKF